MNWNDFDVDPNYIAIINDGKRRITARIAIVKKQYKPVEFLQDAWNFFITMTTDTLEQIKKAEDYRVMSAEFNLSIKILKIERKGT